MVSLTLTGFLALCVLPSFFLLSFFVTASSHTHGPVARTQRPIVETFARIFIRDNVLKGLFKDHLITNHVFAVRAPHGSHGTDGNEGVRVVVSRLDFSRRYTGSMCQSGNKNRAAQLSSLVIPITARMWILTGSRGVTDDVSSCHSRPYNKWLAWLDWVQPLCLSFPSPQREMPTGLSASHILFWFSCGKIPQRPLVRDWWLLLASSLP